LQKEEMPPIEFTKIYPNISLPPKLIQEINSLIKLKATKSESYWHEGEKNIIEFIKESIQEAESKAKILPKGSGKLESLNSLNQKYIRKYDH
jgi:predicted nucleotidyltransferase